MPENKSSDPTRGPPLRRPLLGIVFFYLAGTCGGVWIGAIHLPSILALALVALVGAFILNMVANDSRHGLRNASLSLFASGLIFMAVFFAGWLAAGLRINNPSPRHLSALMQEPREGVEIIGLVASDPELRKVGSGKRQYWSFALRVEQVSRLGYFQSARGEVSVNLPQGAELPAYGEPGSEARRILQGERWQLSGALIDRAFDSGHDSAPGFTLVKSLVPCRFIFQADRLLSGRRLAAASRFNLLHWCFRLRHKCSAILAHGIEHRPDVVGILNALVLGRRSELPFELRQAFVASGTYHIFAISGQHVAIVAMFIVVALQFSGVCRVKWFYYLAPALVVFAIMTGMSTSAVRGCLMALACFLGPLFLRRPDIPSALALAALIIVGADPLQLFQAGFLLSFGVVAGLIVLCPPLIAVVDKMTGPDPFRLEIEGWGRRRARAAARWLIFLLIASTAAWLVSTPLIARWFNLISPIAIAANLCVVPLATLVLLAGCLSIVFGWFCPFVAGAFNSANVLFVSLMAGVPVALARVPFGFYYVKSPPLWFVGLWFMALIVWRLYYRNARVWVAGLLVLLLAGAGAWLVQKKEWEIHVLNIDRCAVCLVRAGGDNILLNCGPRYQARNVLRYLRKNGINRVRTLFCPRPDSLHAGAAPDISAAIKVDEEWRGMQRLEAYSTGSVNFPTKMDPPSRDKVLETSRGAQRPPSEKFRWAASSARGSSWRSDLTDKVVVMIATNANAPLAFDIGVRDVSIPVTVAVEEQGKFQEENIPRAGSNAQFRVVCRPVSEKRDTDDFSRSLELRLPGQVDLGPGRGIVFSPGKKGIVIKPVLLRP